MHVPVYDLDIARANATNADFFWPVDREASTPVRDRLMADLIPRLRGRDPMDDPAWGSLRILFKFFLVDMLNLFQAHAVVAGFERAGRQLLIPDRFDVLKAVAEGRVPEPPILQRLRWGPGARPNLAYLRRTIRGLQINGVKPRLLGRADPRRDILAMERSELLERHARSLAAPVFYTFPWEWFASLSAETPASDRAALEAADAIVASSEAAFAAGGVALSAHGRDYVRRWAAKAQPLVCAHLERLYRRAADLPKTFWTGSIAADIWVRLFCRAVKRHGGTVVGHDHGWGDAHYELLQKHFVEYDDCDVFVTYNRAGVAVSQREIRPDLLLSEPAAEIRSATLLPPIPRRRNVVRRIPALERRAGTRVMYLATAFHGYGARLRPILADPVYLDWQARLLRHLQQRKVETIYKPHPEGRSKPPAGFAESFGARTVTARFEAVWHEADAFLIDHVASTVVALVFRANKPVIFINLGFPAVYPEAEELMKRACYVVRGWADTNNRIQIDWAQLDAALEQIKAGQRGPADPTFADTYFANTATID